MSAPVSSALRSWSFLYYCGFAMVWIGVAMEGMEFFFSCWRAWKRKGKRTAVEPWAEPPSKIEMPHWAHFVAHSGFVILLIGLAVEENSNHHINGLKDSEISRLTIKLDSTTQQAGEAIKQAADANLLAEQTQSTNLVLRSNVASLEIKWNESLGFPKWLTEDEVAALTKKMAEFSKERVFVARLENEPSSYKLGEYLLTELHLCGVRAERHRIPNISPELLGFGIEVFDARDNPNPAQIKNLIEVFKGRYYIHETLWIPATLTPEHTNCIYIKVGSR
jgi:hypothetical protein